MMRLRIHDLLRFGRLFHQHRKRRHVGVPLDQRRHWPKQVDGAGIELPHLVANAGSVVVDADRAPILEWAQAVAGEMDLADAGRWQATKVMARIETVVARAYEHIVDVAQDAAVGARGDLGDELPFRDGGMAVTQIRRWILDQDPATQEILRYLDVAADDVERLLGER